MQVLEKYLRETELSLPISNIRGMQMVSIDAAGMVISKNSSIKVKTLALHPTAQPMQVAGESVCSSP